MKNKPKKKLHCRVSNKEIFLKKENLIPILEDIKDLIKSTAIETQTILIKTMNERFDEVSKKFDEMSGKFEESRISTLERVA